jgi:hypothetical protein
MTPLYERASFTVPVAEGKRSACPRGHWLGANGRCVQCGRKLWELEGELVAEPTDAELQAAMEALRAESPLERTQVFALEFPAENPATGGLIVEADLAPVRLVATEEGVKVIPAVRAEVVQVVTEKPIASRSQLTFTASCIGCWDKDLCARIRICQRAEVDAWEAGG